MIKEISHILLLVILWRIRHFHDCWWGTKWSNCYEERLGYIYQNYKYSHPFTQQPHSVTLSHKYSRVLVK